MNPDKSLEVIARQLIVANRLKHIALSDKSEESDLPSYWDERKKYLEDLLNDINKDEQIMEA